MAFSLMLQGFRRFKMSEFFKKMGGRQNFFIEEARKTRGKKLKFKAIFWKFFLSLTFLIGVWDKIKVRL